MRGRTYWFPDHLTRPTGVLGSRPHPRNRPRRSLSSPCVPDAPRILDARRERCGTHGRGDAREMAGARGDRHVTSPTRSRTRSEMRTFDVVVIGAGPAGEVAAGRLAGDGLETALVE